MKKKIQKPIYIKPKNRGKLRKELGVKPGKTIPEHELLSKMKLANPSEKKRIQFALNARKWHHA